MFSNAFRRTFLCVLLLLAAALFAPSQVLAHANLTKAIPAPGTVVQEAPTQLLLDFSETLEPEYIDLKLYDNEGDLIQTPPVHLQKGDASIMVADLPPLIHGTYTVIWSVVSEDGHPISETYTFSVVHTTPVTPPHTSHDHSAGNEQSQLHDGLLLLLRYAVESLLLLGAGLYAISAYAKRTGMPGWRDLLGRKSRLAWLALMLGTLALWFTYAAMVPGLNVTESLLLGRIDAVAQSPFALMVLIQLVLLLLLAIPSMVGGWYAAVWVLLVANLALGGHAMAQTPLWSAITLRILHLLTIAAWLGALTYLLLALPWQKRQAASGAAIDSQKFRTFFLRVVIVSAALVFLSGVLMVAEQSGWTALFTALTTGALWRNLLFIKIALMLIMLSAAWMQNQRWRGDMSELSLPLIRIEWLIGFVILLLGVWISQLTYPGA